MRRIEILLFDGLDELDVVAPFEILVSAGYRVDLVTVEPCRRVDAAHGLTLTPTGVSGQPDLLGARIAGVCTGAMLIAAAGILRGRPAVTHRSALDDLRGFDVDVHPEARVVDAGDVLTSGGVTSGIDLALHLIELDRGPEAALKEAARIEHDYRGPVLT
jgi:putative intracellular protease/amidase